jgi:hypothetical protein
MRVLHFVERDAEAGRVVLATPDGDEQFELAVDEGLRSAVAPGTAEAAPPAKPAGGRPESEPKITPREIQVRVRSGETPQDLADAYHVGLDWVLRFAGPVLGERERMAGEARRAKARRSTTEGQTVIFGEAVDERFKAHGIDPADVRWDAHRRADGQWVISAHWIGAQIERAAEWSFQLAGRTVAPIDDTAADLLSDRPIRPIALPEPEAEPVLSVMPELVAFPARPDADTGPLPRPEQLFDQARFAEPESEPELESVSEPEPSFDEPPLPIHVPDAPATERIPKLTNLGVAQRDEESEEARAARASIPSWDDILLGVRRKRD